MSTSTKSRKLRVVVAVILIFIILAAAVYGYYGSILQQGQQVRAEFPRPPLIKGCYEYTSNTGWQSTDCFSQEFVRTHVTHPQALGSALNEGNGAKPGILGITPSNVIANPNAPIPRSGCCAHPITSASVTLTDLLSFGSITDSSFGSGGFSIQLNTNQFIGRNGHTYWVQFVAQNFNTVGNAFGIWQIDITVACNSPPGCGNNAGYICTCVGIGPQLLPLISSNALWVQAFVVPSPASPVTPFLPIYPFGLLLAIAYLPNVDLPSAYAVVTPDAYGLSAGKWQTVSGTILGAGGGSQAQFSTPVFEQTTLTADYQVSSIADLIALVPNTYTDGTTAESNNLLYSALPPQLTYSADGTVTLTTTSFV